LSNNSKENTSASPSIIIGGDVCPIDSNIEVFSQGNIDEILNDILPIWNSADMRVINLECPLTEKRKPFIKYGLLLSAPTECIKGLVNIKVDSVSLANNHILDQGRVGIQNTIALLDNVGISHFGAGSNLQNAQNLVIRQIRNKKVGFMGISYIEFNITNKDDWGVNPVDVIANIKAIRSVRKEVDVLIILLHDGREHYRYPTPRLQKYCRFLAEEGVNVIICQHSHCIGSFERYNNSLIVYGQGNFIFNEFRNVRSSFFKGLLLKLTINNNNQVDIEWIPVRQIPGLGGVRLAQTEEKKHILDEFYCRSREILDERFVDLKWQEYCLSVQNELEDILYCHSRYLCHLNKLIRYSDWLYSDQHKLCLRTLIQSDIYREVLLTLWHELDQNI
jgi:poly-gamma-glutamate synthesis protein (capsule biosynthesis protein)